MGRRPSERKGKASPAGPIGLAEATAIHAAISSKREHTIALMSSRNKAVSSYSVSGVKTTNSELISLCTGATSLRNAAKELNKKPETEANRCKGCQPRFTAKFTGQATDPSNRLILHTTPSQMKD